MSLRNRGLLVCALLGLLEAAFLLVACGPEATPTPTALPAGYLPSTKATAPITIDGNPTEAVWSKAKSIAIPVTGGANFVNGATRVMVKSAYDAEKVYFLFQWSDPTESQQRSPWQKQPDGSWKKLTSGPPGDNNTYYEDKLAVLWNINVAGFKEGGCVVCHPGEGKPYGNMYTTSPGEVADMWHWKSIRTDPVGQVDDQYLDSVRYDKDKAPEAGRHSDPKTSGGYADNVNKENTGPAFGAPDQKPAPPYYIMDAAKQPVDPAKYKANDEVAGILVSAFVGDRGDVAGKGVYRDGTWTLEVSRKLATGSQYDVQFSDLSKEYDFAVAVFDNAQVRHAFQAGASHLIFEK